MPIYVYSLKAFNVITENNIMETVNMHIKRNDNKATKLYRKVDTAITKTKWFIFSFESSAK